MSYARVPSFNKAAPWALLAATLSLGAALAGCSSDASAPEGGAGSSSTAGAPSGVAGAVGSAGAPNGGASVGGGASAGAANYAGAGGGTAGSNSGGASTSGGTSGSSGGSTSAGGTSAGASNSGGGSSGSLGGGGTAAGGASAGSGSGGSGGQVTHTGTWKVMPLGDSITGSTCYPQLLSQDFKNGGHTNFEFVGTQTSNQSCGNGVPQIKMEGHPGYGVTYLPQNSTRGACTKTSGCGSYTELKTWAAEKPDIVMMHFGTNDVWDGQPTASIVSAYLSVISEFRKQNPNVIFFVSKIIKLNPSGCGSCLTNVANLVAALTPSWASTNSTATSPLYIVDDYDSGYDPDSATDSSDHVHPLLPGAVKVANATYNGVIVAKYF